MKLMLVLCLLLPSFERIVRELHDRNQAYGEAETRLKLIEEGQREMEGNDDKEVLIYLAQRVRQEKAKQEKVRQEGDQKKVEDNTCPSCVML
jgi:hypothetical protein